MTPADRPDAALRTAVDAVADALNRLDRALEPEHGDHGDDCPVCNASMAIPLSWIKLLAAINGRAADRGGEGIEARWWRCARGHVFIPDPDNRQDGSDAPMLCMVEDYYGEPCQDSTHLIGPYDTAEHALAARLQAKDPAPTEDEPR